MPKRTGKHGSNSRKRESGRMRMMLPTVEDMELKRKLDEEREAATKETKR